MAPADHLSAPGSASYDSNGVAVGDGTWNFEKNTFLLPNLMGLDFNTMRYNGMGNRFSTVSQYHAIVMAHGVLAAMIFLFIVPAAVMIARFYTRQPGWAIKYHSMIQISTVLLLTPVLVLGWFAVGPNRSWTNPHHAIGLAIYIMFLLQIIGGRLVRSIQRRSVRVAIHQWSGRLIALLGIIQVPLGLTLYGSPRYLFILFSLWLAFLLLLYFILDYRSKPMRGRDPYISGGRSEVPYGPESEYRTEVTEAKPERSGWAKWLGPLAGGGLLWAFMRHRNKKKEEGDGSRTGSRSRSRSRSYSRGPEVVPSRRGSASYVDEEKFTEMDSGRDDKKGTWMKGLLGVGAALGAGKLVHSMMNRRKEKRAYEDEYSAVSTETPRRDRIGRNSRPPGSDYGYSDYTETTRNEPPGRRGSILPPPGNPPAVAQALSAAEERTSNRPMTPRPSHGRSQSGYGVEGSDYSSYVSPSRRRDEDQGGRAGGVAKGVLAGLGMGWLAKKWSDRSKRREEERRLRDEEDQRSGMMGSRYTGDGFSSPSRIRRNSQRPSGRRPPHSALGTSVTGLTEESSQFEPRPHVTGHSGPPMPPLPAGAPIPVPMPVGGSHGRAGSRARHDSAEPVEMPAMPPDPHGVLHESGSDAYFSSGPPGRRHSSRRRRSERAAAAAAASASALAAQEEARHRGDSRGGSPGGPVSVKVKVHDDKDRNVTLRRLTEEEAAASRRDQRRRRNDSMSSLSGADTPTRRRYRRDDDSSQRRAERAAESAVEGSAAPLPPLSPPNPAFAAGRRPKDSAYYSGQPGPAGGLHTPLGGADASSIGSPDSHGTWSAMSPSPSGAMGKPTDSSAADNRRRRRLERRRSASRPTGADMFD